MSFKLRIFALVAAVLIIAGGRAGAQTITLTVTSSASSLHVSNNLTYTITVTNNLAFLPSAVVSNTLPSTVQFVGAVPNASGTFTTNGNGVVFDIGTSGFSVGTFVQMTLTVKPMQVGLVTNLVEFFTPNATNAPSVSVMTQVTNTIPPSADLGVAITVPTTAVVTNDLIAYGVSVTNSGPNAAPGVMLTNTLPPGVIFKGSYTVVSNNVILSLGTLNSGRSTNFLFTIQPTNAGVLTLFAAVGSSGILETNTANNTASNSITVIDYLPGDLVAVTNSTQIYNPQNGLVEQSIKLSNVGTNAVAAARVVVTGLTSRLFNAAGTNNGNPFVVYTAPLTAPLAPGLSVTLLLQFFALDYFPFTNSQMQAFAVPVPDLTPPAPASSSTNLNLTRILKLSNGNMMIEFSAITNRTYTVVYSDNVLFSNAMIAPPSIVAGANRKQWVDYGPPTTVSSPTNSTARFYRVFLNP